MMKHIATLILLSIFIPLSLISQNYNDPVLFTVDGTPVHLSEFNYIYSKTNGEKADFSKQSLEEYLDLYTKFKLKVKKAKEMQLDTIPQLKSELQGYRRQLADSYLIDKEVTEKLIREAYERAKTNIDISHVLINLRPNARPEDTLKAYNRALEAKKMLEGGMDFATVANSFSDDKSVKRNNGRIGFVSVPFPNGFYALENAAYAQKEGTLSGPIRTNGGYHILKVHGKRPARGEIEAAHILIRKKDRTAAEAKGLIDSLYTAIKSGGDFEQIAKDFSEDKTTALKGGYIGFFGINRYERVFEDAAFSIAEDGAYSDPFESSVGWHVIKRISQKGIQPYNIEKSRLETKIKKDTRFEKAKEAMLEKIKKDSKLEENEATLKEFIAGETDTFMTFKWKAPKEGSPAPLFSLGGGKEKYTLGDFTDFLGKSSRKRIRMNKKITVDEAVRQLYQEFVDQSCLKFEESRLEEKYPEFKSLMREYEEGILLFEATKMLVWDKASQDSAGLANFYKTIEGKYRWEERAVVTQYSISTEHKDRIDEIRKMAKLMPMTDVLAKVNLDGERILMAEERTFEKSRFDYKDTSWEVGALSEVEQNARNKTLNFIKIEQLLPVSIKTLQEARGYVVADYQDQLERKWVEDLRDEYNIKINQGVFKKLIKK